MKKGEIDLILAKLWAEPIGMFGAIIALIALVFQFLSYRVDSARRSEERLPLIFKVRLDNYKIGDEKPDQNGNRKAEAAFGISITNSSTLVSQISSYEIKFISSDMDGYGLKSTKCAQFEKSALKNGLSIPPGQEKNFAETFEGDVSIISLVVGGVELQRANQIIAEKTCDANFTANGFD